MVKNLKGKITSVYLLLVLTIAIVGLSAVFTLYTLRKSVDGLIIDNYKSINASNNMMESIEIQNVDIINYISGGKQESINSYYENSDDFYKWFNIERNNITEKGEREYVESIQKTYIEFLKLFSKLQEVKNSEGTEKALEYYDSNMVPVFTDIRQQLRDLSLLNEQVMIKSKDSVTEDANNSMYIILSLSIIAVLAGFFFSIFFTNKFLKPIYLLTETMKLVKEGDLNQQAPIISEDEIGLLAKEFNNMTKRLQVFEESTLGKLMEERNKSVAIVKGISDPLIVLDRNFKIMLLNNACEKFFNMHEEMVQGKHFLEIVRNGELFDYIWNVYESKEEYSEKIMSLKHEACEYYFNASITMMKDNYSDVSQIMIFLKNITEIKQVEKMKTEFVSSVSHEFKTPLTSLMMGTSLIMDQGIGSLNEKQKNIMETIKEDTDKLLNLVNNLLELSKVENDKSIFQMKKCSINEIIEGCLKDFYKSAEVKNIYLHCKIEKNLPSIVVDYEKLSWVINNLINNSLKFTKEQGEIFVNTYKGEEKIYVSVRDTGIGIPDEYITRIFDKFMQVKDDDSDTSGTGLGLAIAKQIVEVHGGEIWCESQLGEGSTFTFTIPVKD